MPITLRKKTLPVPKIAQGTRPSVEQVSSGGRKVVSLHLNDDLSDPKMDYTGAKRVLLTHVASTLDKVEAKNKPRMRMAMKMIWRDAFFEELTDRRLDEMGL